MLGAQDFGPETLLEWRQLARERGARLPAWHVPLTAAGLWRWLKRLAVPRQAFLAWCGYRRLEDFVAANARWPLRAAVGLLLETWPGPSSSPPARASSAGPPAPPPAQPRAS